VAECQSGVDTILSACLFCPKFYYQQCATQLNCLKLKFRNKKCPHTTDGLRLVRSIAAVVVEVAVPAALNTATVGTRELRHRFARAIVCTANAPCRKTNHPSFTYEISCSRIGLFFTTSQALWPVMLQDITRQGDYGRQVSRHWSMLIKNLKPNQLRHHNVRIEVSK